MSMEGNYLICDKKDKSSKKMLKRKLPCCDRNEKKRQKFFQHNCDYCECMFRKKIDLDNHVNSIHRCKKCREIVLTDEEILQHEETHKREEEEKRERELELKRKNDEFVVNFVIPKKLNEYKPDPDNELDFHYIFDKHSKHIGKEEILHFVTNLGLEIGNFTGYEIIGGDDVIYLLEKGAIFEDTATHWLDCRSDLYTCNELIDYYLEKEFTIKPLWVGRLIEDLRGIYDLIERIKSKYNFTFDEIYDARCEYNFFNDDTKKQFYVDVHKHFPDPDFEDPFKDPFEHYEHVSNEHVEDFLHKRYWYDEEDDKLSIVIEKYPKSYSITLGKCKEIMKQDLQVLISKYRTAIDKYNDSNEEVSKLFDEKEEIECMIDAEIDNVVMEYEHNAYESDSSWCDVMDEIDKIALPERNYWANKVALIYFVISKK